MNVNSGGPHILLFERDQQLTTLLMSEFQLAGYECHPARTAVEVFDAIARYPIRLVLVNLAQAAAGRREFWVALDAQRRGRGVQVLTFRCMNIAGYGSDYSEETSRTVLTDMEVEGMMGIMNLVDAVRSRIPGSTTGSYSRIADIPVTTLQESGNPNTVRRAAVEPSGTPKTPVQTTASLSMQATNPSLAVPSASNLPTSEPVQPARVNRPGNPASGFSEKIRAIIYPSSRSFSPVPETNWVPHNPQSAAATQRAAQDTAARPQGGQSAHPLINREAGSQRELAPTGPPVLESLSAGSPLQERETGLAQLSRMVHESNLSKEDQEADLQVLNRPTSPLAQPAVQQARPVDVHTIHPQSLRASPIQDIPIESEQEYRGERTGARATLSEDTASVLVTVPPVSSSSRIAMPPSKEAKSPETTDLLEIDGVEGITPEIEEDAIARVFAEMPRLSGTKIQNEPSAADVTSDDTLLNIVQSLPPMSSLPTPPSPPKVPVLSGRATRTLGSVLLEGHLVPQHRMEVAQHIQRMLRGVDMNYQLGEILLMFKLLTPDQLLAASLVSYGLISAAQISGLGRIRQELHFMGLEYDLESLLVLFRVLTPDQLREVRASWSG